MVGEVSGGYGDVYSPKFKRCWAVRVLIVDTRIQHGGSVPRKHEDEDAEPCPRLLVGQSSRRTYLFPSAQPQNR